jgi:Histidine kinase-, DNA gyrase B-, and HSP90-like ATPase
MTTLSLIAKQDYLEKVARTRDPIRAISEFVWNALDADATSISVEFAMNVLGGIQEIVIRDNGVGINHTQASRDFGRLGDSWKRTSHRSPKLQRALHGKEGRGRLRFFSLAEKGRWRSVFKDKAGMQELVIEILAGALEKCDVSDPSASSCTDTGTVVELAPLKETFDWLLGREAFLEFNAVFASYVLQYPGVSISYNGRAIDPADTILQSYEFPKQTIVGPHRRVEDLSLKVIEWNSATESRKMAVVQRSEARHI